MNKVKKLIIFLRSGKTVVISNPEILAADEIQDRFTEKLESERKCVYIKNIDRNPGSPHKHDKDELHMFFVDEIAGVTISSFS